MTTMDQLIEGLCKGRITMYKLIEGLCEGHTMESLPKDEIQRLVQRLYEDEAFTRDPFTVNTNIKRIQDATGIKPSDAVIQGAYEIMIISGVWHLGYMESLQKMTGVKPVFKEEVVQRGYKALVERCDGYNVAGAKKLQEMTGIDPIIDEETAQKVSEDLTWFLDSQNLKRSLKCLEQFMEFTGIKQVIPEETVQNVWYKTIISNGLHDSIEQLEKITGIKPSKETIEKNLGSGRWSLKDKPEEADKLKKLLEQYLH